MRVAIFRAFPKALRIGMYNIQEIGLAKALLRHGVSTDFYTFVDGVFETRIIERYLDSELRIIPLKGLKLLNRFSIVCGLNERIRGGNYDVVQIHEYNQISNAQVINVAKQAGAKVVLYQGVYSDFKGFGRLYNTVFDTLYLKRLRADVDVTISKTFSAHEYIRTKGIKRSFVLPVGLDLTPFYKSRETDGAEMVDGYRKDHKHLFLYIGVLEPRRDLVFFLAVLKELNVRHGENSFGLLIVGDGPDLPNLVSKTKEIGLESCVEILPPVPNSQLASYYKIADSFILPSHYEIFGMVVLEALYFGLPVFSSPTAGPVDIIKENVLGLILEMKIKTWSDSISQYVYSQRQTIQDAYNRTQFVRENYSWSQIASRYLQVVKPLVDN